MALFKINRTVVKKIAVKPKPIGHWGNGDYELKLENENQLDEVFELIIQSYKRNR